MAKDQKQDEAGEVSEALARASKHFQKWQNFGPTFKQALDDYMALRFDVIQLVNAQSALAVANREAEANKAKAEREAQMRLQSVEQGHRALVDRLTKKEVELSNKLAEVEKRERIANDKAHKYELLCEEYERKAAGLTRMETVVRR